MSIMEVTPRELRDTDIREAFRGYHRDDVDELLERAAVAMDAQAERVQQLSERVKESEGDATRGRETEDILQRTLLLAQRAADDAVAEAQVQANQILDEAQGKARTVLAEAENTARRMVEGERRRLEAEVLDLGARREALLADVESLERFDSDYRTRLREAIEADLDTLAARPDVGMAPRPTVHEVDLPVPSEGIATRDLPTHEPSEPVSHTVELDAVPPFPQPEPQRPPERQPEPESQLEPQSQLGSDPGVSAAPAAPAWSHDPTTGPRATSGGAEGGSGLFGPDESVEAEVLDDEAFFASLREAVRDDAPLGPRDDALPDRDLYDQDTADSGRFGNVFKRRR